MESPGYQVAIALTGYQNSVSSVKLSPDGRTGESADKTIRIWYVETGQCQKTLRTNSRGFNDLSWSSDCQSICSACYDKCVHIYDVSSGRRTARLSGHMNYVFSVKYNRESIMIASGSFDENVRLYGVRSSRTLYVLPAHDQPVSAVDFSPDSSVIVYPLIMIIYACGILASVKLIRGDSKKPVSYVKFSPNGIFL